FLYFYKTILGVFIILSISLLLALIFLFMIIIKKYKFLIKGKQEPVETKRLLVFSSFVFLSSLSAIIFANIDKLMLGYFIQAEFVGYYTAIFSIISGLLGLFSLSIVVFPVFTQIHGKRLKRAFKKTFHYLAILIFPITIGLAYLFIPIIRILYSGAYTPPEHNFTLTITSVFLSFLFLEGIITSLYIYLFNAREKPKIPAITMIITTILNVLFNYLLISYLIQFRPGYGLIGASLATFVSRYIYLGSLLILGKNKLNVAPNKNSIIKPLISSIIMLTFLFIFDYLVPLNIFYGIIMVVSAVLIYILIMFLIRGIKKEDFELLKLFK
ncbi:MAG TPA: polysaccharide biosynthesis protein, partial [Candidatus Omnitrophica bacterium]|nr:polysaccharide biosynthesis protein [Candidatus Omnitrophota bacterium]